jgi:hypothetical protein
MKDIARSLNGNLAFFLYKELGREVVGEGTVTEWGWKRRAARGSFLVVQVSGSLRRCPTQRLSNLATEPARYFAQVGPKRQSLPGNNAKAQFAKREMRKSVAAHGVGVR